MTSDAWRACGEGAPGWLIRWVFVPLCLLLPAATYVRLWFGVDVTDEAFYVAMAHAFAAGSRPYVDEFNITQTAALELTPFVWAYERVVGSTDGVVLFVRHLFFALLAATAAVVFARLRGEVSRPVAAAIAGLVFVFVPFSIPSVSYNTLGALSFTIGLLATRSQRRHPRRPEQVLAGLALGAGAFAYPPLAPAVVAACAVTWRRDRAAVPALCAGLVTPVALAVVLVVYATPARVLEATELLGTYRAHETFAAKAVAVIRGAWDALPGPPPLRYGLAGLLSMSLVSRRVAAVALPALAVAFAAQLDGALPRGQLLLAMVALLGPALRVWRDPDERSTWFVACVAGACTCFASSNGFTNACLGLLPAFLCVVAWTARAASQLDDERASVPERLLLAVGCCLVGVVLEVAQFTYVYRDAPMRELTVTMGPGPYCGLRTTPTRRDDLDRVTRDLASAVPGRRSIFVYDGFPAGYLLTDLVPRCPSVWISPRAHYPVDRQFFVRYFDQNGPPDVILEHDPLNDPELRDPTDPLRARFREPAYDVLIERENHRVLVRRP